MPNSLGPDQSVMSIASLGRFIGLALSLAAVAAILWKASGAVTELGHDFHTPAFIASIGLASLAYGGLVGLIGLAWHSLLASTCQSPLPLREAFTIFGRSQLLKYLPSNMLHYVGRHAAAYRSGAPHGALVWSSVAEAVLLTAAAVAVSALFAQSLVARFLDQLQSPVWLRVMLPSFALVAFAVATAYVLKRGADAKVRRLSSLAKGALIASGLYVLFFLANGVLLTALVSALPDAARQSPLLLAGIVSLAWFAGFIVPGAPAGVGIRELILTIGLGEVGLGSSALSIALAYRIVTLLGDLLLAASAYALTPRRTV